jgi:geranylgeranyl reductase family protein
MAAHDVAVIGAGPAGSTCAYRLARAGARVVLIDKARFPRDKPCGGGVTMRAARLLPFSIDPVVEEVIDRVECRLDFGPRFEREAHTPLAYMTQRKRLDQFLLERAADAGAEVREGVALDAREVDADVVVCADGCNGTSAKQLGFDPEVVHGVALEANFPRDERYARTMVLEIASVPGGYGWIFPKGDHVNVGVGGWASEGPRLRAHLRRMCEAYGIDPDAAAETRGYRLPMRRPGAALLRGNALAIGDAAGLVDPFSGDGMYEAFYSARLAAEAVLAGDLPSYAAAVERHIAPLTHAGWGAKRAFDRFPRTTFALARLPVTWRAVEKVLRGDLGTPGEARGLEKVAVRTIYRVAKAAGA